MAKLYFTHGTVGAQKTTELLATAYNFEEHGGKTLLTRPSTDPTDGNYLVSRIGLRREVDFLTTPDLDIEQEILRRKQELEQLSVVLVDQAHFLQPMQVDQLLRLSAVHRIPVMAWGLRTDHTTHAFPGSLRLLETANVIQDSIAMCGYGNACEHRALFNAPMVAGAFALRGAGAEIDGEVTFTALCAKHYIEQFGLPGDTD